MNENQLRHRLKGVKVCASDNLPKSARFVIANNDPSHLPGSHWVCMHIPRRGPAEYFDSTGHPPLPIFENYLVTRSSKYKKNVLRVQDYGTDTCGEFCVYYVDRRRRGWSFQKIMDTFSRDLSINEMLVLLE